MEDFVLTEYRIKLPIDMNSNSTFHEINFSDNSKDTIVLNYKINFSYSKQCDWEVFLDSLYINHTFQQIELAEEKYYFNYDFLNMYYVQI